MVRELEIKRRETSTPQQQQQTVRTNSNTGYQQSQQHSDGVRRLVPSVPNEQVEVLKTNVGRLKICKRHVTLATTSSQNDGVSGRNSVLGRLKLVRPNRVVGGQSIFDSNGKQRLSIKDKISQGVVPLNSNQFVKGENGRWTKLDQPTKKLSLSTLRAQIRNKARSDVSEKDKEEEVDFEHEGDSIQGEEDIEYEDQGEEEYLEVVEEKRNYRGNQEHNREDSFRDNTNSRKESKSQNSISNSKVNAQTSLKTLSNNIVNRQQQQTGQISAGKTAAASSKTAGTSSNNNSNTQSIQQKSSRAQQPKSPDFEIEEDQTNNDSRFVVAVNNLPRKCTESDIRSLLRSEKGDILEVSLEEGDSYDCLIYFATESSQLRAVKLLDNKKFEGQILRADPAEVIVTKQGQNEEQMQQEGESDRDINEDDYDDYEEQEEQEKQLALNQRIKQNQQQQSKNMISSYIQKNKDSQQQLQGSNTTTNSISSRIVESNKSSRLSNSNNNQQSSRSQQYSRTDGQSNSRNIKEQMQQSTKNTRKDQQRNSQSHSREKVVVRSKNYNASLSPERSPNGRRAGDLSDSRSDSGRNRSDSRNRNKRRSSPIGRYTNNSNNGQAIHRRSRQSQSPDRGRLSPQIRGNRTIQNNKETARNNDRERQNSRRDSPKREAYRR